MGEKRALDDATRIQNGGWKTLAGSIMLLTFFVLLFMGIPIAIALVLAALLYMTCFTDIPLVILPNRYWEVLISSRYWPCPSL